MLIPRDACDLARALSDIGGWRTALFSFAEEGFDVVHDGCSAFVNFASAPLPFLDSVAILFTEATAKEAEAFADMFGQPIQRRQVSSPLTSADRTWLNNLVAVRFGELLAELTDGQAENAALRARIDDLRTKYNLLEMYLLRHDVPPLRKVWHAPFREGANLSTSVPFVAALPCSSWGLTRLQLWLVGAPLGGTECLAVQLKATDSREILANWSILPEQTDYRSGWISFDLEESLSFYGRSLEIKISGTGWQIGLSAPWVVAEDSLDGARSFCGPAIRAFATLPGIRGPQALLLPVDDRRRIWLLGEELARARPLVVPPNLGFLPVSYNADGLVVHPVSGMTMVAIIDGGCPPHTGLAHLSIRHGHTQGSPFLVTLLPQDLGTASVGETITDSLHFSEMAEELRSELRPTSFGHDGGGILRSDAVCAPQSLQAGVTKEIGPLPSGSWVRIAAGAQARIAFLLEPLSQDRALWIATRPAEMELTNLAWATVLSVEFVLPDG